MNYSLEQCKRDMIAIWSWLADNPNKGKVDYLLNVDERFMMFDSHCPCCHYDDVACNTHTESGYLSGEVIKKRTSKACSLCPISWSKEKLLGDDSCAALDSPYRCWEKTREAGDNLGAVIYARAIVKLAEQIEVDKK